MAEIEGRASGGQTQGTRVEKPWGWEIIWAETPSYVGKLLHVRAGQRLSLQYHDQKLETQCLLSGRAILTMGDPEGELRELEMEPHRGYTVYPHQRHRITALEDAVIAEVSTPEMGTTYRLEDDFARPHQTEDLRQLERSATS
jgi:mannose-6-phosphate isomerase-like protein (cupin superfamily)